MKKVCSHKAGSVRFRRWSRKGYAVFVSLHYAVTIGHVCRSIADAALSKNKSFSTVNRKQVSSGSDAEAHELPDEGGGGGFAFLSQAGTAVLLWLVMQNTVVASGKVASCPEGSTPIYNIISGMGKMRKRVSPVPLFCFVYECVLKRRLTQIFADIIIKIQSALICENLRFNSKT